MNAHNLPRLVLILGSALLGLSACAAPAPTPMPVPPTATFPAPAAAALPPTATTAPLATTQPLASTAGASAGVTITWFGQSMFTLKIANGPLIMLDPVGPSVGYKVAPINNVDVVTISHEHSDHNYIALAPGSLVLRGLAGLDWAKVDETSKGAHIRSVNVYHDYTQGAARGKNAVFVIEANGLKIVHLGDLGHQLSPEQIAAIGSVDVLMIPVGGNFTIDAAQATLVMGALKPRVVLPMHYKTPVATPAVGTVDAFLTGKTVQKISGNQVMLSAQSLPSVATVYLLGYE
jgi:L-ascorbate metabolism protein UlaG (beta-lactamase superfamily)